MGFLNYPKRLLEHCRVPYLKAYGSAQLKVSVFLCFVYQFFSCLLVNLFKTLYIGNEELLFKISKGL